MTYCPKSRAKIGSMQDLSHDRGGTGLLHTFTFDFTIQRMKFFEGTKHCQYVRRGDDWECLHKLSLGVLFFNERFVLCLSQCF